MLLMSHSGKISVKEKIDQMGTAQRENRLKMASFIIAHPEYFKDLLNLVFEIEYKYYHKAAWVLEFVLEKNPEWLLPHIDFFTNNLHLLKNDSAIRPVAKVCQRLSLAYVKKKDVKYLNFVKHKHIKRIVEAGFDWMIGAYRIAPQVYTMDTLYLFGSLSHADFHWIHLALKNIILQNSASKSKGYRTHGKKILKLIP